MDRRLFLAGLAASIPTGIFASPPTTAVLPHFRNVENIRRMAASSSRLLNPAFRNITSFSLVDTSNGAIVDSHQADLALPPASVTKAITTVYARHILGSDFRFITRLVASGPVVNGIVQGDLYLVGGGDPALDTDELAGIVEMALAGGLKGLTGSFYIDDTALPQISEIDPSQPDYLGYNPSIGGLNLNFNRVFFEWKRSGSNHNLSLDARGARYRPEIQSISISVENRGAPVFEYSNTAGRDKWSVAKSALGEGGGRWLPVRQPSNYAGEVFTTIAASLGLRLPQHRHQKAPGNAIELARFSSETLDTTLKWLLKYSNNLTAECIGLMASRKLGHDVKSLRSSASKMGQWTTSKLHVSGSKFLNHSGLTDKSRVSSNEMAGILASSISQGHLDNLLKEVELQDTNGNSLNTQGVEVVAKTGTLNYTRGLAGYLTNGNKKYSFAIFVADLAERANIPMSQRERPPGARTWSSHAKRQEKDLLRHWVNTML